MTSYPPPPWRLIGTCVQAFGLVPIHIARRSVPAGLQLVSVAPGRTLGAIYCARYERESTLRYHELAIAPALTRVGYRPGFWISHIYVDSPASCAGGHAIWHLPKQLARFEWRDSEVLVFQESARLCRVRWKPGGFELPAPLLVPVFSQDGDTLHSFSVRGLVGAAMCRGSLDIEADAPFADFGFQARRTVFRASLRARISGTTAACWRSR